MKRHFISLLQLLIIISLLALITTDTIIAAAGEQNNSESPPRKVVLQKNATIDLTQMLKYDGSGAATASVLKIVKKYYDLAQWFSSKLNFAFKYQTKDTNGKVTSTEEYKNIKTGNVSDSLFEIPSGYTKFSMN